MAWMSETPQDFVNEVRGWMFLTTLQMWRYMQRHPDISGVSMAQKMYDLHARLAMPWACLIVTLFGIPAGARSGRQSALAGVFLAVAFFFGFYALSQIGLFLGKTQVIWPWTGAWLSNIVFLAAGLIMMARMR
jgi:lipopolysaccharide export system permease protein